MKKFNALMFSLLLAGLWLGVAIRILADAPTPETLYVVELPAASTEALISAQVTATWYTEAHHITYTVHAMWINESAVVTGSVGVTGTAYLTADLDMEHMDHSYTVTVETVDVTATGEISSLAHIAGVAFGDDLLTPGVYSDVVNADELDHGGFFIWLERVPTGTLEITGTWLVTMTDAGSSGGMGGGAMTNTSFLPLIMSNYTVGPTPPSDNEGSSDYASDTTWWQWAQDIERFFSPVIERISYVRADIAALNNGTCGTPWNAFTPPLDPTAPVELYMLSGDPPVTAIAYTFGHSLGRPIAYLRAIQQSGNVLGLNYFVMLIYFMTAGITWVVFVTIITYSARLIRGAVDLIIRIYELIPFKAT